MTVSLLHPVKNYRRGPVEYAGRYAASDYGTERALYVYRNGAEVARVDPFWPGGIPADRKAAGRQLQARFLEICAEHGAEVTP